MPAAPYSGALHELVRSSWCRRGGALRLTCRCKKPHLSLGTSWEGIYWPQLRYWPCIIVVKANWCLFVLSKCVLEIFAGCWIQFIFIFRYEAAVVFHALMHITLLFWLQEGNYQLQKTLFLRGAEKFWSMHCVVKDADFSQFNFL